ncbi:MAG: RNA methyltransferase [Chloroflexales bacterium]|nr:RNA methyltransferase [Chloroflexales bacterium]
MTTTAQSLYYLHTMPGLEQVAWSEITQRFPRAVFGSIKQVPQKNGLLLFRSADDPQALLDLRCAEDLFIVAARGFKVAPNEQGLRQIYAAVRNAKGARAALATWEDVYGNLEQPATFRVVVREQGAAGQMRRDIGRSASDALLDGWPGRWSRVEEEADVELWVNLLGEELLCGLRLSRAEMRHRDYKVQHLPASLRPSVAAAMVQLTQPAPADVFLDPMAGAGTILLERAAFGAFGRLIGGDNSPDALDALDANMRSVPSGVELHEWDARALPLEDSSVDKAALNLPFGRQISPGENLRALYAATFAELARVVRPGGIIVALAADPSAVDGALRASPPLHMTKRLEVNVLGYDAVVSVIKRGA